MNPLILIAEDDADIRGLLKLYLEGEGFRVLEADNGARALELARAQSPDMAILDIMMPQLNGFELTRALRKFSDIPILILSAKSQDNDKILGLNLGADDYITKPFNPVEIVARVKAQLRRARRYNDGNHQPSADVIDFSGLVINRATHTCTLNERPLSLTPTEFNLLWLLCENRGKVMNCEDLFHQVWGEKYFTNSNNTVMVHIRHLREKMSGPMGKSDFIKTVWGVGYKVEE